jgi:nucleotide-binding universal stress UspA family protein
MLVRLSRLLPSYVLPAADIPISSSIPIDEFEREAKAAADRVLAAAGVVAPRAGVTHRTASAGGELAARVLVNGARRRRCDAIVVASEGRNALLRLLTGSVIPGLITESPVPVLVCKNSGNREAKSNDGCRVSPATCGSPPGLASGAVTATAPKWILCPGQASAS